MKLFDYIFLLVHFLRWRLTWDRGDVNYRPEGMKSSKFMSALDAVKLINDNDTVLSCGMAANARCSIFYYALRDLYRESQRPRNLTWVGLGAMGTRSRAPGSIEELNFPGIISRYIGGHLETVKVQLKLAEQGHIELHSMPQGVMTRIFDAQTRGEFSVVSDVGIGTFLDPRVGGGTPVVPGKGDSFVKLSGNSLEYSLPPINAGMFVATYADEEGNIYINNSALITENMQAARAARANGGKVLVSVGALREKSEKEIFLHAEDVDAVVLNPYTEQTGSVPVKRYWPGFTEGAEEDAERYLNVMRRGNILAGITPVRRETELAMARAAAHIFTTAACRGAEVNIGVGLPEEVCRLIREGGLGGDVNFGTETGVWGGIPSPGVFFGSAVNPKKIMSSFEIFNMWRDKLDITILGLLECDSDGNINVSKRGEGPVNFIGPGGLPDLVNSAKTIIFIGTWMTGAKMRIKKGRLEIIKKGRCKFMPAVSQITFSGKRALKLGKKVFYVTSIGIFRLTERGMELIEIMPGIDLQKDVLDDTEMKIIIPPGGPRIIEESIVTGKGFRLKWF